MPRAGIHDPYWDSLGGGERYAAATCQLLVKLGYQVDVWWPSNIADQIKERFSIDIAAANFVPQQNLADYDLVFWISDGSIPSSLAKETIIHFQVPFHDQNSGSMSNRLKIKLYPVVCNSQFTKSLIDKTYGINSRVIYPPVDVEVNYQGAKLNQIISLARFSQTLHAKRQDVLIKAFSQLALPGWKLVLAGGVADQDYLNSLQQQALGLDVEFVANPTALQARHLLSQAKLFWSATGFDVNENEFPEKMEHFGITAVEAMATGTVPLVTAKGGHKETVVDKQTGYWWNTIEELAALSLQLAKDDLLWEKLSRQAKTQSQKFSTQEFEKQMTTLIQS